MATVDPSIPLGFKPIDIMSPAQAVSLAEIVKQSKERKEERPFRLAALKSEQEKNALTLQQLQLNLKKSQGVLKIAQTPGMMDDNGVPTADAVKAGMSIDPEIGQAWGKLRRDAAKAKTEETYKNLEAQSLQGQIDRDFVKAVKENQTELAKVYTSKLNKAIADHAENPHETAVAAVQAEADRRHKSGLLTDAQYQKVISTPWDVNMAEGIIAAGEPTKTPSEYEDIIKRQKGLDPKSTEWKQLEERRKYLTEHPAPITVMQTSTGTPVTVEPVRGGEARVREIKMPGTGDQKLSLQKIGAQGVTPLTPEEAASAGAQHAAGQPLTQVVPGYGSAVANKREQVRKAAIEQIKSENPGISDREAGERLAQASIDFVAGRRSIGQLQTMLGATRQAVTQLEFNIEKTKETLQSMPGSDLSPVINAIIRQEQQWTGDPKYSRLFYFMSATAQESARILQGGQASVAQLHAGAAEEARKWANINMTPKQFIEGVAPAMLDEGRFRLQSYEYAIKKGGIGGGRPVEGSDALVKPYAPSGQGGWKIEKVD